MSLFYPLASPLERPAGSFVATVVFFVDGPTPHSDHLQGEREGGVLVMNGRTEGAREKQHSSSQYTHVAKETCNCG